MARGPVLRLLARLVLLALVFTVALYYRDDIGQALAGVVTLEPFVLLVLPLFVLWNWIASFAWLTLHRALTVGTPPTAWTLSWIRLQAQALNLVLPLANVGGDILRTALISRNNGQLAGTASAVILDKVCDISAGVVFAICGLVLGLDLFEHSAAPIAALMLFLLLGLAGLPLALHSIGKRISPAQSRVARALAPIGQAPGKMAAAFYRALAWHLAERVLSAGEIYLAMAASGMALGFVDTLFISSVMTAYSLIFFFIPGQLGAIEAGLVSAFVSLGLPPTAGLTVALVRRARQLVLIATGTALLVLGGRARSHRPEIEACD